MQKILITGAARGIGHDAAFALARRGHHVIATVHRVEQVHALQIEIEKQGLSMVVEQLDITNADDIARVVPNDLDVLINNAAVSESGPMAEVPLDRQRAVFETNVLGTLAVTQKAIKPMLERKQGRIVIVSSVAGRIVLPYLGPYTVTKFAVEAMGDALRTEVAPFGVRVSLIEPGLILTGFNEQMAETKYAWLNSTSLFSSDIHNMRAHDQALSVNSHPTTSVVDAIIDAVESRHPKARYVAPKSYGLMLFFAHLLPAWLKDRILRRAAGLV